MASQYIKEKLSNMVYERKLDKMGKSICDENNWPYMSTEKLFFHITKGKVTIDDPVNAAFVRSVYNKHI